MSDSWIVLREEVCTIRIFQGRDRNAWLQSRSGPVQSKNKNFGPGPCPKEKLKFLAEPGPPILFSDFGSDRLSLIDLIQLLADNKCIFFADDLFFRKLSKQLI